MRLAPSCLSVYPSVRQHGLIQLLLDGRIFMKFNVWVFTENLQRKFQFHSNTARITSTYIKTNVHLWSHIAQFILEWEMFQTKVVEKIETHILCSINFFSENRIIYKTMWKNMVKPDRLHTIQHGIYGLWFRASSNLQIKQNNQPDAHLVVKSFIV
jgi:hypothetical protein